VIAAAGAVVAAEVAAEVAIVEVLCTVMYRM
jgi:hypothetical protein